MDRERGWPWVGGVAGFVCVASLTAAWRATRDPAPAFTAEDRRALYESNLRNFAESCERPPGVDRNPGLRAFCRQQAQLLQLLSECDAECARRTASFTAAEPSK